MDGIVSGNKEIQKLEKMSDNDYIKKALTLRILSPRIVEAILEGTQPRDLTADKLRKIKTVDWHEQRKILNF